MRVLQGLKIAQTLLNAGITTVRDVGNEAGYASVDVRNAINKGWFTGPTILTSGKIIAPFGGQSSGTPPEVGPIWRYEYIDADGPAGNSQSRPRKYLLRRRSDQTRFR